MLTPKIITFVYWLMLFGTLFLALVVRYNQGESGNLTGCGIIVFGAIGSRIWCELLIVLFKIHENLQKIANKYE
jgi:hypothetical protein